jgi:hypothetical protein
MRRTFHGIVVAALASTLLVSVCADAQDNFKMLGEKDVRATIVGREITDGSHWSIYVRPDGALVGAESGSVWNGTWNIQKNKLCLSNPGSKTLDCYDVWMSGSTISLRLKKDDDSFVGVVERHKSN